MGADIYKKIWELSPNINDKETYEQLVELTRDLIQIYDSQGRFFQDPFEPTRRRKLSLPFQEVNNELRGATCIVTGGMGLVGSTLVNELLKFDIDTIVIIDIAQKYHSFLDDNRVVHHQVDIRNFQDLSEIFSTYKPEFVFHTAAIRDPGYAEANVYETVTTNILGTLNMVKITESVGTVKQFVFSSTGKASRYYTEEVYAATKKICEYILDTHSRTSHIKYSFVRFTHILDNSLMNDELKHCCRTANYLRIHSPGKYVTAQNGLEAALLMLNALVHSEIKRCNFLVVRYLEWPVESLEMALYYIKISGRNIPVRFVGNPLGYQEKFFRGQMDWSDPNDLNNLINVYECQYKRHNSVEDVVIANICAVDGKLLNDSILKFGLVKDEGGTRSTLLKTLRMLVKSSLTEVKMEDTVNILNWGLQPQFLEIEKAKISDYGEIIPMMFESLEGTEYYSQVENLLCDVR